MCWVYQKRADDLFVVGYYVPHHGGGSVWHPDEEYRTREEAAERVHYLNGGSSEAIRAAGSHRPSFGGGPG